jgi:hypothetical protein
MCVSRFGCLEAFDLRNMEGTRTNFQVKGSVEVEGFDFCRNLGCAGIGHKKGVILVDILRWKESAFTGSGWFGGGSLKNVRQLAFGTQKTAILNMQCGLNDIGILVEGSG